MEKRRYESPIGSLLLIADEGTLTYCNWDHPDCLKKLEASLRRMKAEESKARMNSEENNPCHRDSEVLDMAIVQLEEYFSGQRRTFRLPIRLYGTEFQLKVWDSLTHIIYGETISYKELAKRAGAPGASRAVANACGANPLCIILPCHRIIPSSSTPSSSIGGYTGGAEKKLSLLVLERFEGCWKV